MAKRLELGAFLILSSACLWAQQQSQPSADISQSPAHVPGPTLTPRSHEERERNYQVEHRIILNVQVTDRSGRPVTGLKEEDFTLLDNGSQRQIESFRLLQGDSPSARAHAILLLDTLNNDSRSMTYERKGIEKFLSQNHARLDHPIAIAVLSETGVRTSQPSQDGTVLIAQLERLSNGLHAASCADEAGDGGLGKPLTGGTMVAINGTVAMQPANEFAKMADCQNQRFKLSLSQLDRLASEEVNVPGRAILVWIGSGWPLLSGRGFVSDTAVTRRNFFDFRVALLTALREGQITLDAVSFPDRLRDQEPQNEVNQALIGGVATEDQASAGSMALQVLAHDSGGLTLMDSKDIAGSIAACLADAASYYVLAFDSRPAARAGEYHSLEVRVDKPGLDARANTAYYAQP